MTCDISPLVCSLFCLTSYSLCSMALVIISIHSLLSYVLTIISDTNVTPGCQLSSTFSLVPSLPLFSFQFSCCHDILQFNSSHRAHILFPFKHRNTLTLLLSLPLLFFFILMAEGKPRQSGLWDKSAGPMGWKPLPMQTGTFKASKFSWSAQ